MIRIDDSGTNQLHQGGEGAEKHGIYSISASSFDDNNVLKSESIFRSMIDIYIKEPNITSLYAITTIVENQTTILTYKCSYSNYSTSSLIINYSMFGVVCFQNIS